MNYTRYKQHTARVSLLIALFLLLSGVTIVRSVTAQESTIAPLGVWAWGAQKTHTDPVGVAGDPTTAGGVGWLYLGDLFFNSNKTKILGDAVSHNFGILQFGGAENESGLPSTNSLYCGTSSVGCAPHYEKVNGVDTLFGWARFKNHSSTWNGWVSLHGQTYKITRTTQTTNDETNGTTVETIISGFAWGGKNIGWIKFAFPNQTETTPPPTDSLCHVTEPNINDGSQTVPLYDGNIVPVDHPITFEAVNNDGTTPDFVSWKDNYNAEVKDLTSDTSATVTVSFPKEMVGTHEIRYSTVPETPGDVSPAQIACIQLVVSTDVQKVDASPYSVDFGVARSQNDPLMQEITISKNENITLKWSLPVVDPTKNEQVKSCTLQSSPNDQGEQSISGDGSKEISGLTSTHTFTFSCIVEKTNGGDPAVVLETFDTSNSPALSKKVRVQFIGEGKIKEF